MSQANEIMILVNEFNNRVQYLFRHVFTKVIGVRPIFTNDREGFAESTKAKLNYSNTRVGDELYVKPAGLLYQKGIKKFDIETGIIDNIPILFTTPEDSDMPFDVFSAVFFMITRYEEYHKHTPDRHGRFRPENSIAHKLHFMDEPVVEIWIGILKDLLMRRYPQLSFHSHAFHYVPTIDVDMAFAYRHKGLLRSSALFTRDFLTGRIGDLVSRTKSLARITDDPFNTFDRIRVMTKGKHKDMIFFYLAGKRGKFDKNISFNQPQMRSIVKNTSAFAQIGLHPSYGSFKKPALIGKEKSTLEQSLNDTVQLSRQHYLRFSLPSTYQNLVKAGITADYSMGYASCTGFRAGTCTPYNFYDLTKEKELDLKIVPFQAMDATFKAYLNQTPHEALAKMLLLKEKVKKYNGLFCIIWHNDSFTNTTEGIAWQHAYTEVLNE